MRKQLTLALLLASAIASATDLEAIGLKFNIVPGGFDIEGVVRLVGPNNNETETVTLSDNSGSISTPASVSIGPFNQFGSFTCTTSPVGAAATRVITATLRSVTKSANVTLVPAPKLARFELDRNDVVGGESIQYEFELTQPVPDPGITINVTSNTSAIPVFNVGMGNGLLTKRGLWTSKPVSAVFNRTITASYSGVTITQNITLHPGPKLLWMKTSAGHISKDSSILIEFEIGGSGYPLLKGLAPFIRCTDPALEFAFDFFNMEPTKRFGKVTVAVSSAQSDSGPSRLVTFEGKLGGVTKTVTVLMLGS